MAEDPGKFHMCFITFALLCVSLPWTGASQCFSNETYEHEGLKCCLCGIGRGLVKHCTENLHYGKCEECGAGTYSSSPSSLPCERCTSCSHASDNLEVEEQCTPGQDTKCRCQKDHYCVSSTERGRCKLCHLCTQCGVEGVKVACSGSSDTVCNEQTEGGIGGGAVFGIIAAIVIVAAALAAAVWFWKKRKSGREVIQQSNGHARDVEMPPLIAPNLNLEHLLPDIAAEIGWTDMKDIAIRSKIRDAEIERCRLDHMGNSKEQTLDLLKTWVESEGKCAGRNLLQRLEQGSKKKKAEEVRKILMKSSNVDLSSAGN